MSVRGLQLIRPNRNVGIVVPVQMTSQTRPEGEANRSVRGVFVRIGDDRERRDATLIATALRLAATVGRWRRRKRGEGTRHRLD